MSDGEHMWEPSPSPEETYSDASGANEDGEWQVEIVGEEIRLDGSSRYEMKWEHWHRKDGSNTTWEKEIERKGPYWSLIKSWNRTQKRVRNALADDSLDMVVQWAEDDVHKRLTYHRRQAYDEKLERRRANPLSTANWDAEIDKALGRLQEPEIGEANARLRVRRVNSTSATGSSADGATFATPSSWSKRSSSLTATLSLRDRSISSGPPTKRGRSRAHPVNSPTSSPRSAVAATPSTVPRKRKAAITPSSAGSSRDVEVTRTLPAVIISQPTLRGRISSAWNKAAKEDLAATVRISPNIRDEDIPRSLRKFKYMERGYNFRDEDGLHTMFDVPHGAFMSCDCIACLDASDCSCRDLSKIYSLGDQVDFSAYSKGLFTFEIPRGVDVVECNKYCGCDESCANRVAQRPRKCGLEIYDTCRYGWGVRTLEDIPCGRVLGTYTGTLIPREKIADLPEEHHGYMFDLDSTEIRDTENPGGKYTVDCYECGNWTRFVNHSCSPNMEVYCVVYDSIPDIHMPYVAFAASMDIRAGTELTIDYHPYADEDKKGKRRASGRECRCGSNVCREWF